MPWTQKLLVGHGKLRQLLLALFRTTVKKIILAPVYGYVKLDTTQIYTQVSIKKLKEVHSLTHPAKAKHTKKIDWHEDEDTEPTADDVLSALASENDE